MVYGAPDARNAISAASFERPYAAVGRGSSVSLSTCSEEGPLTSDRGYEDEPSNTCFGRSRCQIRHRHVIDAIIHFVGYDRALCATRQDARHA